MDTLSPGSALGTSFSRIGEAGISQISESGAPIKYLDLLLTPDAGESGAELESAADYDLAADLLDDSPTGASDSFPKGSPFEVTPPSSHALGARRLSQSLDDEVGVSRGSPKTDKGQGDIALCVRVRACADSDVCAVVDEHRSVVRMAPNFACRTQMYEASYASDHAFGPHATQERVFATAVSPICDAVIRGYNGAVIAYGQTASGKTHTIVGEAHGEGQGVAPRAINAIFAALSVRVDWSVEVSALEIYNERVRDLLTPSSSVLDVHEVHGCETGLRFRCRDATCLPVQSPDDAIAALIQSMQRRETARTDMNHRSSRSHLVFTVSVLQKDHEAGTALRSRLNLVDLAGSERLKRTMVGDFSGRYPVVQGSRDTLSTSVGAGRTARGQRRETGEINKSLLHLTMVIQRLSSAGGAQQYVPYRDSVLTRLLAESFGGNSKTCLIITCSPSLANREETRSSLEFGRRAKFVRNRPQVNVEVEGEASQSDEVAKLRQAMIALESERDGMRIGQEASEERSWKAEQRFQEEAIAANDQRERLVARSEELESALGEEAREAAQAKNEFNSRLQDTQSENAALQALTAELQAALAERGKVVSGLEAKCCAFDTRCDVQLTELQAALAERGKVVSGLEAKCCALDTRCDVQLTELQEENVVAARHSVERSRHRRALEISRATSAWESMVLRCLWDEDCDAWRKERSHHHARLSRCRGLPTGAGQNDASGGSDASEQPTGAAIETLREEWATALAERTRRLDESTSRASALEVALRRSSFDAATQAAKAREESDAAKAERDVEHAAAQRRFNAEVARLENELAVQALRAEEERVALHERLREAHEASSRLRDEQESAAARMQEERTEVSQRWQKDALKVRAESAVFVKALEEDRAGLHERWQADVARLENARAALALELERQKGTHALVVAALEEEKTMLHRRWQDDIARVEAAKAAVVSDIETEKNILRQKWEDALTELQRSQEATAAAQRTLEEERAAVTLAVEAEKSRLRNDFEEELARTLQDAAAERSKLEVDNDSLRQKLNEALSLLQEQDDARAGDTEDRQAVSQHGCQKPAQATSQSIIASEDPVPSVASVPQFDTESVQLRAHISELNMQLEAMSQMRVKSDGWVHQLGLEVARLCRQLQEAQDGVKNQAVPEAVPEESVPEETVPEKAVLEKAVPEEAVLEAHEIGTVHEGEQTRLSEQDPLNLRDDCEPTAFTEQNAIFGQDGTARDPALADILERRRLISEGLAGPALFDMAASDDDAGGEAASELDVSPAEDPRHTDVKEDIAGSGQVCFNMAAEDSDAGENTSFCEPTPLSPGMWNAGVGADGIFPNGADAPDTA